MPTPVDDRSSKKLNEKLERAADKKERVIVKRGPKPVAVIVPYGDFQKLRALERLLEDPEMVGRPSQAQRLLRLLVRRLEDQMDGSEARRRIADPAEAPRPLSELREKLGL